MSRDIITAPCMVGGMDEEVRRIRVGDRFALIDAVDYRRVARMPWRILCGHNGKLYVYARIGKLTVYLHRWIAETPKGFETDHVNGDGLDNRRVNLRTATASQNSANMGKPRRPDGGAHTSRYKGVSWDKSRKRWQSKITVAGRCRNLGRYDDEAQAARAYDAAAIVHFGEFARLNFPPEAVA